MNSVFTTRNLVFLGLNAPFGARCFLTEILRVVQDVQVAAVLMHLLALGAFWHKNHEKRQTGAIYMS